MSHKNRERIATAVQAAFETMETRRMMSAVQLTDGVLVINADPHTASNIIVDLHSPEGRIRGYATGFEATFSVDDVKAIRITGSDGDDNVYIDPSLRLPTLIQTGAGDDRVRGGAGADTVDAGTGDDVVHGGRGHDRLAGGDGDDVVHGNVGNDTVDGGAGDDRLYGQGGDDTLYGGEGFDLLAGQSGDDKIYGGEGDDHLAGGTDDDRLFGGDGDDAVYGHRGDDRLVGGDGVDSIHGGVGKNSVRVDGNNGELPASDLTEAPDVTNPQPDDDGETPVPTPPPVIPEPPPVVPELPPVNNTPDPDNGSGGGGVNTPAPATGKAPRPVIRVMGDADVIAGGTLHVHALDSVLNGGTVLSSTFQWDFGDTSGRYNELKGFNAAHVYEKPGVYTISLTVTNERGRSAVATLKVNVSVDDRPTVYVDGAKGDDDNDGSSPAKAVRSAEKAFELAGDDTRVLFKRGHQYTIDTTLVINEDRVLVGAYGTGDLPVLYRVDGVGDGIFRTTEAAEDVVIEDLRFDSEYDADPDGAAPKIPVTGVFTGGTNITVRDVEFVNVGNGVNANLNPTGLLVMDSEATEEYGTRSYFVWGQGTDLVILGNTSADSSREHNVRTSGVERILVAYNNFAQTDRSDDDSGDGQKGTIEIHRGLYSYVAENNVHGGVIRTGPRGGGWEPEDTSTEWSVIENNRLDDVGIHVYAGTRHLMIRNNVIERYESTRHGAAIQFHDAESGSRLSGDVYVLNNTAIERRASGTFLKMGVELQPESVTVKNNLWVNANFRSGSNSSSGIYVSDDNLGSFREISGNVWATPKASAEWAEGGINYVGNSWGRRGAYKTATQWNAMDEVGTDYFTNDVTLRDVYQVVLHNTTVGAALTRAA